MEKHTNPSLWRWATDCPIVHSEASKDCILPDSYPDIRKILYTAADVTPGHTALVGGKLQTEGVLRCRVLFSDEEEQLHSVGFELDYSGQVPCNAEGDEPHLCCDSRLESISVRALNPRKLSLRGKVELTPMLFYQCPDEPELSPELSDISLEKKMQTVTCWRLSHWSESGIEAAEDLSLGQEPPIGELLHSDLQLETVSCNADEGEVSFSGNGLLHLFYTTAEGALQYANISFPFRSSIQEGAPDSLCRVKLTPEQVSVVPTEDATGEARGVELDFTYSIDAAVAQRMICTCPIDCYSVEKATAVRQETLSLLCDLQTVSREFNRAPEADSEGMRQVLGCFGRVVADSREKGESGIILHCTAQVTLIGLDEEGNPMSVQLVENFPWEFESEILCCENFAVTPSAVIEGDRIKVKLRGVCTGFSAKRGALAFARSIVPAEDRLHSAEDSMTLCYPAPGETLWDIAKRYRTTQSALLSANTIPEGTLPSVLLIPRTIKL